MAGKKGSKGPNKSRGVNKKIEQTARRSEKSKRQEDTGPRQRQDLSKGKDEKIESAVEAGEKSKRQEDTGAREMP